MLLAVQGVLNKAEIERLKALAETDAFVDGAVSANLLAKRGVKRNEELSGKAEHREEFNQLALSALYRNEIIQLAAMPKRIQTPVLSRYRSGMRYGNHVDMPLMGRFDPIRLDLSITVFLNPPGSYEGGELVLDTGFGEKAVKLEPGDGILYPTTMLHRVAEVRRGERLAVVTWMQSMVPEPDRRKMLYDLAKVTQWACDMAPEAAEYHTLANIRANLVRMWARG